MSMFVFLLSTLVGICFIILGDCKVSCLDSFSVGSKSMVALSLAELPGNSGQIVLAMGGLDNKIHLYCGGRTGKVYYFHPHNFILLTWTFCLFSFFMKWLSYLLTSLFHMNPACTCM